jgi:hypothetical protein
MHGGDLTEIHGMKADAAKFKMVIQTSYIGKPPT